MIKQAMDSLENNAARCAVHRPIKPTFTALTWVQLGSISTYKALPQKKRLAGVLGEFLPHFVDNL